MLLSVEAGFRLGRKFETNTSAETKAQIAIVEAGLLGVLALLLGFTMSMAVSRFESRKQLHILRPSTTNKVAAPNFAAVAAKLTIARNCQRQMTLSLAIVLFLL